VGWSSRIQKSAQPSFNSKDGKIKKKKKKKVLGGDEGKGPLQKDSIKMRQTSRNIDGDKGGRKLVTEGRGPCKCNS